MSAVAGFRPTSLAEAVAIRARENAIPCAGGTDLMVRMRRCAGALPSFERPVLFLDRCPELHGIRALSDRVAIGAMTSLAELERSPLVHQLLREAIRQMGGPALRSIATIGGNICNASPAADTLPFLYAVEACVAVAGPGGERTIPVRELVSGPGTTSLRAGEILRAVEIPLLPPVLWLWRKVGTRRANALTKVSIAAFASFEDGRIHTARIALGAVAPTVIRLEPLEERLEAEGMDGDSALVAPSIVHGAVRPIDDQRSTADYRREVAAGLVQTFVRLVAA